MPLQIKALLFDVFGTCVDWRSSVAKEGVEIGKRYRLRDIDWHDFADTWRSLYHPQMELVRSGQRSWVKLDVLHRESLAVVWSRFDLAPIADDALDEFNRVWHRLDPWPDTVAGLKRLKENFIIAPNSNAHLALSTNLAKHAGLPWDVILGAEITRAYKPQAEAYLRNVAALDLEPHQVMMVAAHNNDLVNSAKCGLRTAFVLRPTEYGVGQRSDLSPEASYDFNVASITELADRLEC